MRFRILRHLEENPEMTQRELARAVGLSVGSLHYKLNALVEAGLVKLDNVTDATDKRRFAYRLTPGGMSEKASLTQRFLRRRIKEYEALKAEIADLRGDVKPKANGNANAPVVR